MAELPESVEAFLKGIAGGCPPMYCEPLDIFHRCMCWWLGRTGRVPAWS